MSRVLKGWIIFMFIFTFTATPVEVGAFETLLAQSNSQSGQNNNTEQYKLPEVLVEDNLEVEQQEYKVDSSSGATRTNTPLIDVPASIQVVPRKLIEDQGAQEVTEIYRNISGVTKFSYGGVTFRGFRQFVDDVRYNGLIGNPFKVFTIPRLFNIERVEVLKGPASVLYGVTQPGGIINYVTKKPLPYRKNTISTTFGFFDGYDGLARGDISAESTGPIDKNGTFLYRLGGFYENRDGFRNNTEFKTIHLTGGFIWNIKKSTKLTLEGEYFNQDLSAHRVRGVPVDEDGDFLTSTGFNTAEPSDFQKFEAYVFQARLDHSFDFGLSLNSTFRYAKTDEAENYHEPNELRMEGGNTIITREFRDQERETDEYSFNTNLVYEGLNTFGVDHTFLAGGEVYFVKEYSRSARAMGVENGGPVPTLGLFDPVYGEVPDDYGFADEDFGVFESESLRYGFYLQDQIGITKYLDIVVGVRLDGFDDEDITNDQNFDDNKFTFRGGAVFKPVENVAIYGNYAEGFVPQSVGNQNPRFGGPFPPVESWQIEGGIKTQLLDNRLGITAALYQITQENLLQNDSDPEADPDALITIGEVRSRGFELNAVGRILPNWLISFAYALNDIEITEDNNPDNIGETLPNAPENVIGIFTRYDFPQTATGIGLGFDFVDDRDGFDPLDTAPSYTLFDLFVYQSLQPLDIPVVSNLDLMLSVRNLFDKEYAESSFSFDNVPASFPGEPRTFLVNLKYDFNR